jgi:hypothetical protein
VAEEHTAEKITRLEREIEVLKKENERLRQLLEEALRAAKRQAAPFSRQKPKAQRGAGELLFLPRLLRILRPATIL